MSSQALTVSLYQTIKKCSTDYTCKFLITIHPRTLEFFLSVPNKQEYLEEMDLDTKLISKCNLARATEAMSPSTPQSSPAALSARAHCKPAVRKAAVSPLLSASSPLHSPEQKIMGTKCLNSNFTGVSTIASTKPLWAPQENDAPLNLSKDFHSQKVVFHFF